tara:strand:- start:386 stop:517 length:132 start_codon:yes stop_codon:yes gene_type:complete
MDGNFVLKMVNRIFEIKRKYYVVPLMLIKRYFGAFELKNQLFE